MDSQLHLIIRLSEDGKAYATSPQAPGLVYGRPSLKELRNDLEDVLSFHFDRPGPFMVAEHHEWHYDIGDGELVIRVAMDEHVADRAAVAERIRGAATVPEQAVSLVSGATNAVGEAVYVCALPSDTCGWLSAQLQPPADAFNVALTIADNFLFTLPVALDDGAKHTWVVSSAPPETQLAEIMQRSPIVTPQGMASLALC